MTDDVDDTDEFDGVASSHQRSEIDSGASLKRWKSLASDPDFEADLGYECEEWEQFETLDDTDQVMFLPSEKEQIKDAAFVVTEEDVLLDLENHC